MKLWPHLFMGDPTPSSFVSVPINSQSPPGKRYQPRLMKTWMYGLVTIYIAVAWFWIFQIKNQLYFANIRLRQSFISFTYLIWRIHKSFSIITDFLTHTNTCILNNSLRQTHTHIQIHTISSHWHILTLSYTTSYSYNHIFTNKNISNMFQYSCIYTFPHMHSHMPYNSFTCIPSHIIAHTLHSFTHNHKY